MISRSYSSLPSEIIYQTIPLPAVLPIHPPPKELLLQKPLLPSSRRTTPVNASYTLSTHLVPSCYLRSGSQHPIPTLPLRKQTREERNHAVKRVYNELKDMGVATEASNWPNSSTKVLWNCLNRYVRNANSFSGSGVTLFFAHATGFPKEIWEPTLEYLLSSPASSIIDEVWCWESIQHGDAALANAGSLSVPFDWQDNARDIANFFVHYLPSEATPKSLPAHIPPLDAQEAAVRSTSGISHRKITLIGHSFGGTSCALAAMLRPALFQSGALVLVDPVIVEPYQAKPRDTRSELFKEYVINALTRRDTWPSRAIAAESFRSSPFFQAWDPAVLSIYIECGLYPSGDSNVSLKTPPILEADIFASTDTAQEVFHRLHEGQLPQDVPLRWIMPGKAAADESSVFGMKASRRRVWVTGPRGGNVSNTRINGAGHLIPHEAPRELANDLEKYLLALFSSSKVGTKLTRSNL